MLTSDKVEIDRIFVQALEYLKPSNRGRRAEPTTGRGVRSRVRQDLPSIPGIPQAARRLDVAASKKFDGISSRGHSYITASREDRLLWNHGWRTATTPATRVRSRRRNKAGPERAHRSPQK